ncbi:putative ABC transport system permease protein [Oceanobacillus limi]|uniref:Putative hemin transport system permease protein HrtB n=1 Tax=Oceanobacillus limi TaxID=930131 RepID=A0A1I0CHS7_9BACI|nr:ABC transporter permease [Oceanobacillus limi]SET18956.1 putative ABC transport system permease protein [Oceanobacillus limi]
MFLAWRELQQNKIRYILICTIITAILFLVFFITGLSNGLGYADSAAISNLKADYVVLNKEADGVLIKSELSTEDIKEIEQKVRTDVSPLTITVSSLTMENTKDVDVTYFTVDTKKYGNVSITEGKNIHELANSEIIADESLKRFGLELNDTIIDSRTDTAMKIAGFTNDHVYSHMPVIFTSKGLGFQSLYSSEDTYYAALYQGAKERFTHFDVQSVEETVKTMPGYSETQGSFMVMKIFLIIISVFVSSVFFYVITIQKIHQFGILKAIGVKTWDIAKAIITQVSMITLLGLCLSGIAFVGVVQIMPEEMPIQLSWQLFIGTGAMFIVLNTAGAMLSVWKVAKVDALEAMRRAE